MTLKSGSHAERPKTIDGRLNEVIELAEAGLTVRDIARATGVSKSTVHRAVARWHQRSSVTVTSRHSPPGSDALSALRACIQGQIALAEDVMISDTVRQRSYRYAGELALRLAELEMIERVEEQLAEEEI